MKKMENGSVVISLGGSVVLSEDVDASFFQALRALVVETSQTRKVYLVIGGGTSARFYISLGRKNGFSETDLDELGIRATRINALFLTKLIPGCNTTIPETTTQAVNIESRVVVMGGTTPGHSTDFVGAELASEAHADCFVIATNVDGIYDKDPRRHADARHLPKVSIDALLAEYGNKWESAGKNMVVDGPALQQIKDHQIQTFVLDGRNLQELRNALNQDVFRGSKILL